MDTSTLSRRNFLRLSAAGCAVSMLRVPELTFAAPTSIPTPPEINPFQIGSIEAFSITDGSLTLPSIQPMLAPEGKPEEIAKILGTNFLPTDHAVLSINVLLLKAGADYILIDTGGGTAMGPIAGKLRPALETLSVKPEQISAVVLSHAHIDHVSGLLQGDTGALAFPNADVFILKTERDFWMSSSPDLSRSHIPDDARKQMTAVAQKALTAVKSKLKVVDSGQKIIDGIELHAAPGHTPGHAAILISSGNEQLLQMADAVHHYALQFAHPEWTIAFDSDPKVAVETRKKLFDRAAVDRQFLMGYHLPFPGFGHIQGAKNGGYEWVPRPWAT